MSMFHEQRRPVVVAVAKTTEQAELIKVTLAAHGFQATVSAASVYPSVDWVEGIRVSVRAEDENAVRELLDRLPLPDADVD